MSKNYDLIVIGTGDAGYKTAISCAEKGWKTAVIDKRPYGGTCALRGCEPKKILAGAAEIMHRIILMNGKGIKQRNTSINWNELMKFKRTFTQPVPQKTEDNFKKVGIDTYHGIAKFTDRLSIEVKDEKLNAKKIVIGSGRKPADLSIEGEQHVIKSDEFLDLENLPERILLIGGGYIAFEFAAIASFAGADVQILHNGQIPLKKFDHDLVQILIKSYKEFGIKITLNAPVRKVEKKGNGFMVYADVSDAVKSFEADLVVHSAGRVPDIDELNLDAASVKSQKNGISVNEYLQSVSNPDVYAGGDCAAVKGGMPLTPVAMHCRDIITKNLLEGNHTKTDFDVVPSVVFSIPVITRAGLLEEEAIKYGKKFMKKFEDTSGWYSSKKIGLKYSGYKSLIEEGTNKLLGVHILGHNAEEVINLFSLAMKSGLTAEDIKKAIYTFPAISSDIQYMV